MKADAMEVLRKAKDNKEETILLVFAPERKLSACALQKRVDEHDFFVPDDPVYQGVHTLTVDDIRSIAAVRFPDLDFSEKNISTKEI